jgi:hypothetical protein
MLGTGAASAIVERNATTTRASTSGGEAGLHSSVAVLISLEPATALFWHGAALLDETSRRLSPFVALHAVLWGYVLSYSVLHTLVNGGQPAVALAIVVAAVALCYPLHAAATLTLQVRALVDSIAHALAGELVGGGTPSTAAGGASGGAVGQLLALHAIVGVRAQRGFCLLGTTVPAGLGARASAMGLALAVCLVQLSLVQASAS